MKEIYQKMGHPISADIPQKWKEAKVNDTLTGYDYTDVRTPTLIIENGGVNNNMQKSVFDGQRRHDYEEFKDVCETVQAQYGTGGNNTPVVTDDFEKSVRRLTPLECERLQGFPDGWTDIGDWVDSKGKKHKIADSPRYKALGNSIALPFWRFLLNRISDQYEDTTPTLGSLFDGIGGFPLVWEERNGKGSAVWASEIEEFPIAVTKYHFPEEEPGTVEKGE